MGVVITMPAFLIACVIFGVNNNIAYAILKVGRCTNIGGCWGGGGGVTCDISYIAMRVN